jgi:hypothetical protein
VSTSGLLLYVVFVVALGIVLYLPFHLWFARKRRRGERLAAGEYGEVFPRRMYPWAAAFVAALFGAVAWGEVNPEGLLGRLVRLPGGVWVVRWLVIAVLVLVVWSWFKAIRAARSKADVMKSERDDA